MKLTRKAHRVVWTEQERVWGGRLGLIIQGLKMERAVQRLEGDVEADWDILRDVMRLIPAPRTKSRPIKESVRRLEHLKRYVPGIEAKRWAPELTQLHGCKVFYKRMTERGQWKVCEKRLVFEDLEVLNEHGQKVSVYTYTTERIKQRVQRHCRAITNYVW